MQIRTFSVDPAIIYSLISAQAGTLAKALLECIMNSVDAGASEVTITFDQTTLRVTDNGRGFTKVEEIEKYFEVFGFPHENDALQSQRVYGQFGIGRAQLWTFASTVWRTAQFQMDVDIKNRGLEYERRDNCEPVPGVTIEGRFYEPLSARDVLVTEKELADLGFVPLVHCKGTPHAAFFSVQSAQKPKIYDKDAATANARISAQLPYIFAVSRFAHYLKAMMRDKIGSFASKSSVENYLNNWIAQYVLLDDNASQERKAQFPLREASIEVAEVAGKPGAYKAVAFLRPHYQLDELSVSLRLVAELPKSAR